VGEEEEGSDHTTKESNEDSREDVGEAQLDNILAEDAWRELGETPEVGSQPVLADPARFDRMRIRIKQSYYNCTVY
jgi:hypothetical protein